MTRRSLVTGGGGFIGRHLVRLLLERGERVRVLDIVPADGAPADGLPQSAEMVLGSITDAACVREAMADVERVYHLAANPNLWAPRAASFLEVNHLGTRTVLAEAERRGVERVVYTSTESILKKSPGMRLWRQQEAAPIDERVELGVEDMPGPYCRSKFLAEAEAHAAARRGLPVVIVNPTMPIGPGDRHLTPPSRMLLGFLNGEMPAYLDCVFNLVDARDVAAGHILAAERGQVGERYILGNTNIGLKQLLDLLHELTGLAMPRLRIPYPVALAAALVAETISAVTGRPPMAPLTGVRLAATPLAFDSRKAVEVLGLPQTPLRRSLLDAIADFARRGLVRRPLPPELTSPVLAP